MASRVVAPLARRAVHVKVEPRTRNIGESREILRTLKTYGDVVSFKNLSYDPIDPAPHTILAIFQHPEAASRLIKASPLHLEIESPAVVTDVLSPSSFDIPNAFARNQSRTMDSSNIQENSQTTTEPENATRKFEIIADLSKVDFDTRIRQGPYYWGYNTDNKSIMQKDLARSVPIEAMSIVSTRQTMLPARLVAKRLAKVERNKSLRQLYEEGVKERKMRNDPEQK